MTLSLICKKITVAVAAFGVVLLPMAVHADDASAKLYQMKCVACHAADGSGTSPAGKALKVKDLRDPDVQKQSDTDLTAIISKGKDKMPAYEKMLKPDEIKGLVAQVRELAAKK